MLAEMSVSAGLVSTLLHQSRLRAPVQSTPTSPARHAAVDAVLTAVLVLLVAGFIELRR